MEGTGEGVADNGILYDSQTGVMEFCEYMCRATSYVNGVQDKEESLKIIVE